MVSLQSDAELGSSYPRTADPRRLAKALGPVLIRHRGAGTVSAAPRADGSVLALGGTIVDNAEDAGTAHTRLLAFLAALK